MKTPLIIAAVGTSLLLAGGCGRNNVEVNELRSENERLTGQLEDIYAEAALLEKQRNTAREENLRLREQLEGMQQQIRNFGTGVASINPNVFGSTAEGGLIVKDVAFKTGSADLTDEARGAIRELANQLKSGEYAGTNVIVIGHTDNTPVVRAETKKQFGDNWGLSGMRSAAVVRELQGAGVSPDRLRGGFRGEHAPVAENKSATGKAQNRRVEIYLAL